MPNTITKKKKGPVKKQHTEINPIKYPPGRIKIYDSFRKLLEKKEFNKITTAEIAITSGVNEALIFRYFKNKRGLLYQIMADDFEKNQIQLRTDLKGIKGALNKLRKFIWSHINSFDNNRVFARILLFEISSFPGFYTSEIYDYVKSWGQIIIEILEEGIKSGDIRTDIEPTRIRQTILGSMQYICFPYIIKNEEMPVDSLADDLFELIFDGFAKR